MEGERVGRSVYFKSMAATKVHRAVFIEAGILYTFGFGRPYHCLSPQPYLSPRDGGPDELGERVVADLTPLGIKAGLSCVCHGTEDHDITAKHEARGENKPERRERRRRSFFVEKRNATVMHG